MARTAAIICWRPSSAEHLLALLSAQIRPPRRVNTQVNELRAFRASKGVTSRVLLLVILDRDRVNLAMARREIRTFCASFAV
ncbi:MAG TPA: hypothetical protein VE979_21930 [Streptosporangiaceae bacterium]|jgi:hypothetical protein|nr:hypothetical protein [Streptosporangiaceae bacterium]